MTSTRSGDATGKRSVFAFGVAPAYSPKCTLFDPKATRKKTLEIPVFFIPLRVIVQKEGVISPVRKLATTMAMNRCTELTLPPEAADEIGEQLTLARHALNVDAGEAYSRALQALDLAQIGSAGDASIVNLKAETLILLGYLDRIGGKLELSAARLHEALVIFLDKPPSRLVCDAWTNLAWVYAFTGDFRHALEYGMRAKKLAEDLGLIDAEAMALDAIGAVHGLAGDSPEALRYFDEALQKARLGGVQIDICFVLNNRAMALMENERYESALEASHESLQLARRLDLVIPALNIIETIAQVYVAMGDLSAAENHLAPALREAELRPPHTVLVNLLTTIGRLRLAQGNKRAAKKLFVRATSAASTIGAFAQEANGHRLLADLYAQQRRWHNAFDHHVRSSNLMRVVLGNTASRQLNLVKVAYQLDVAEREAEIQRRRASELQTEIESHKRTQAKLEVLATTDPLTGLLNRRQFFARAEEEGHKTFLYRAPMTILMIDIDHFKQVNDSHGHRIGDQVLQAMSVFLRASLRNADFVGRFGGEEFATLLPNTEIQEGTRVAERIRQRVESTPVSTAAGPLLVTVSIGVAGYHEGVEPSPHIVEDLLQKADAALYEAKRSGRNRVVSC